MITQAVISPPESKGVYQAKMESECFGEAAELLNRKVLKFTEELQMDLSMALAEVSWATAHCSSFSLAAR